MALSLMLGEPVGRYCEARGGAFRPLAIWSASSGLSTRPRRVAPPERNAQAFDTAQTLRRTVSHVALEEEGLTHDDLLAGLRKVGEPESGRIRLATLEETGQISVVVER